MDLRPQVLLFESDGLHGGSVLLERSLMLKTAQEKTPILWNLKEYFHGESNAISQKEIRMKQKTHSGAKKRLKLLPSGKVKRKSTKMRHLNSHMSSKTKRQLGKGGYVDDANMYQTRRTLVF